MDAKPASARGDRHRNGSGPSRDRATAKETMVIQTSDRMGSLAGSDHDPCDVDRGRIEARYNSEFRALHIRGKQIEMNPGASGQHPSCYRIP
jgi:hypothetical protein